MPAYRPPLISANEITPKNIYLSRRGFLGTAAGLAAIRLAGRRLLPRRFPQNTAPTSWMRNSPRSMLSPAIIISTNSVSENPTRRKIPASSSPPRTVKVDGLVSKPQEFGIEELMKYPLEERTYRMRCVEGWSMVIPWIGFPLATLLDKAEPLGSAKYVAFETVVRPDEMPGQSGLFQPLSWPYVEGLRLDEARHPLTILAVGLYGETLPNQNGAPIRLVVPWKYGFKGIKSIVRISLVEKQPETTWKNSNAREYGFYSNVNPNVDHPRWSRATEQRIGEGGFFGTENRPTLMFNGYDEVASLYAGMDLKANY